MGKRDNRTLTPKLRFPEFTGQTLREVQLTEVTAESMTRNGKALPATSVMGVTKAQGIVPMEDRLIASDIARYKIVQKDWFAYNPMRLNIGSIARWEGETDILVSPDYVVFKCLNEAGAGISPTYLDHFRRSNAWDDFVQEGGDGSVRVRIYYRDIARLKLALPSLGEQTKIADCLTSLDELVAAQGRKLEALKARKNALVQRLFPREGETLPRLRFPEFRKGREWDAKQLAKVCERIMDGTHFSPKSKFGTKPYLTSKNIRNGTLDLTELAYISEDEHREIYKRCPVKKGDVLLTKDGANTGNCALNTLDIEFSLLSSVAVLRGDTAQISQAFLFQSILSHRTRKIIEDSMSGQAITRITLEKLGKYQIPVPSLVEQQTIADCLASLDELVAAEARKMAALNAHKKGLMQQLFPSPEGD